MIGRTVLQTVAQKPSTILHSNYIAVDYAVLAIAIESKPVFARVSLDQTLTDADR